MKVIRDEKPGYFTVLTRKTLLFKLVESIVFLIFIMLLMVGYGYDHPQFKLLAVLGGIATLIITPLFYRLVINPRYVLTDVHLEIKKRGQKRTIPLTKVSRGYDMRYIYLMDGKKTVLTVSDSFIHDLNSQLELLKRKLK